MTASNHENPVERRAEGRERLVVSGLAVLGIVCLWIATVMPEAGPGVSRALETATHLVRDLGIALLIAAVLAFAVDKYLKATLVSSVATQVSHHVAQNTSNYVFGYFVPPDMKDELLELMRPAVLRRNYKLTLVLDTLENGQPDFVRVTTKISFTLSNLKDQEISFRHSLAMSSMFAEIEAPQILRFACRAKSRDAYEYDYQGFDSLVAAHDGKLEINRSSDNRDLSVRRTVSIPPLSSDFEFRTESTEIMKVPYADVLSFADVTSLVEVETRCPKDMEILIEFGKGREVPVYKDPPNRPTLWRYSGVCLAGQHVRYDFKRTTARRIDPPAAGADTKSQAKADQAQAE